MKQIKVFYKLYTAIQIYIYLQGIKITFALRKGTEQVNYETITCFIKGFTTGFQKLTSLLYFKYLTCHNLLEFQFTRVYLL